MTRAIKAGARNSTSDMARINKIEELANNIIDLTEELTAEAGQSASEETADGGKSVDLEQSVQQVRDAWYQVQRPIPMAMPTSQEMYVVTVRDTDAIVRCGDSYMLVPYERDADGKITFAPQNEWTDVKQEWVPVASEGGTGKAADVMATVAGEDYPASAFLVTEHAFKPTTWHLRVMDKDGKPDHALMGAAWAALHGGYRGNVYEGTGKAEALTKLTALYKKEKMDLPDSGGKSVDPGDLLSVKALGGDRIGSYGVLWGNKKQRDLTGQWFEPDTDDLLTVFKGMGKLPFFYHHTMDSAVKADVVGQVDVMVPDDIGIWYEAQLSRASKFRSVVKQLAGEGALGSSSGAAPGGRAVLPSGKISRWPIVEMSGTPTPAEPRMMERPIAEIKAAFTSIGLEFPNEGPSGKGDEESRRADLERERELLNLLDLEAA